VTSANYINQEQPTPDTNGETNQHGTNTEPVISPAIGTTKPESPPSSQKGGQSHHQKKHWLDYLEAGMGGIGLIVLIAYTIFTALMYCANKKAAEAAKTSADFLRWQTRPWVSHFTGPDLLSPSNLYGLPNTQSVQLKAQVNVVNTGDSPALHSKVIAEWLTDVAPPQWPRCHTNNAPTLTKERPLFPKGGDSGAETHDLNVRISPSDLQAVQGKLKTFYMVGCVFYEDGVGTRYRTQMCMFYDPDINTLKRASKKVPERSYEYVWRYCGTGNYTETQKNGQYTPD